MDKKEILEKAIGLVEVNGTDYEKEVWLPVFDNMSIEQLNMFVGQVGKDLELLPVLTKSYIEKKKLMDNPEGLKKYLEEERNEIKDLLDK